MFCDLVICGVLCFVFKKKKKKRKRKKSKNLGIPLIIAKIKNWKES